MIRISGGTLRREHSVCGSMATVCYNSSNYDNKDGSEHAAEYLEYSRTYVAVELLLEYGCMYYLFLEHRRLFDFVGTKLMLESMDRAFPTIKQNIFREEEPWRQRSYLKAGQKPRKFT